jgi:Transcription elongation factor, N-terminal
MNKNKNNPLVATLLARLLPIEKEMESVLDKLKMARLDGDLSENADWKILKEKLEDLQRKIFFLKEKIALMKSKTAPEILITYQLLESGEEKKIMLTEE